MTDQTRSGASPKRRPLARAVDHVSFRIQDLELAKEFYVDVLGCEEIPRPDLPNPGAWLQMGSVQVHLTWASEEHDGGRPPRQPSGFAGHTAFLIDDYDEALSRLRDFGSPFSEGDYGFRQIFAQDPAGNVVELICRD